MNTLHFVTGLGAGMSAGALIGIERQWRQRMAGLQTNTLVAAGSALFVLLSGAFGSGDPSRVAAQVVSGIGFLGAGVILRDGRNISGINTAATLWCSAAAGSLAGAGLPGYAVAGAAVVVAVNTAFSGLAQRLDRRPGSRDEVPVRYQVQVVVAAREAAHVRTLLVQSLSGSGSRLHTVVSADGGENGQVRIRAEITHGSTDSAPVETAVARMGMEPAVISAAWEQTAV